MHPMQGRIYIKDLKDNIGKEIIIAGWVDVRRDQGKMVFFDMRDMTGLVQCVVLPNHMSVKIPQQKISAPSAPKCLSTPGGGGVSEPKVSQSLWKSHSVTPRGGG